MHFYALLGFYNRNGLIWGLEPGLNQETLSPICSNIFLQCIKKVCFFHWMGSGFILQGLQNVPVASISSPPPLHLRNIPINQITNTLCSQFQNQKTTLSHAWHPGIWKAPETTGAQGISNQRPGPATPFKLNHPGRTVTQFHCHSLSPHKISKALNPRRTERN